MTLFIYGAIIIIGTGILLSFIFIINILEEIKKVIQDKVVVFNVQNHIHLDRTDSQEKPQSLKLFTEQEESTVISQQGSDTCKTNGQSSN